MVKDFDNGLDKLQKAVDEEEQKIKKIILQLLHSRGLIAFDASKAVLDKDLEKLIVGKG